jgi:hypothetical protein
MSKILHYHTETPFWKFWTRLNRQLTSDGKPVGNLKMSWTRCVHLYDENGKALATSKPGMSFGMERDILDSNGKKIGYLKKVVDINLLRPGQMLWTIQKDGKDYIQIDFRKTNDTLKKLAKYGRSTDNVGMACEFIHGSKVLATMYSVTGGFVEMHDLIFEDGVGEEDRLLCLELFGFKLHNLLK